MHCTDLMRVTILYRQVTILAAVGILIFGVATSFAQSIEVFTVLRLCVAISSVSLFTCGYCYCMEIGRTQISNFLAKEQM